MTDPVWSVIFMVFLSLVLAGLMVAYIFYIIKQEDKDGIDDTPEQEELLQLQSNRDQ
jgi:uncharacterized protein YpmS